MQNDTLLYALAVAADALPEHFESLDDVVEFCQRATNPTGPQFLTHAMSGLSLNHCYFTVMNEVVEMAALKPLEFLNGQRCDDAFERDDRDSALAVCQLDTDEIPAVIDALRDLLNLQEPWFNVFFAALEPFGADMEEVGEAYDMADVNMNLNHGLGIGGDSPFFIFRALKTLLAVCQHAFHDGLHVLYVVECEH